MTDYELRLRIVSLNSQKIFVLKSMLPKKSVERRNSSPNPQGGLGLSFQITTPESFRNSSLSPAGFFQELEDIAGTDFTAFPKRSAAALTQHLQEMPEKPKPCNSTPLSSNSGRSWGISEESFLIETIGPKWKEVTAGVKNIIAQHKLRLGHLSNCILLARS